MSKVVILGAGGQLGRELSLLYPNALKFFHTGPNPNKIDLIGLDKVESILSELHPDIILNAAALANVDFCEKHKQIGYMVNALSVRALVRTARNLGSILIHVSTDYVFDGKDGNYSEDSVPNPLNFYGLSKLIGDTYASSYENSIIVRTSGVFGYSMNFPLFVLEKLRSNEPVQAIRGYYSPIHARNLAEAIKSLLVSKFRGIINVAGDRISRYELAKGIAEKFGLDDSLVSENKEISLMSATRPFDSSLDISLAKKHLDFDFHSLASNLSVFAKQLGLA